MNTTPAASETWITDIGASASAATCRPQLAVAMIMPSANHFEEYSARAERSGWRSSTLGTELAPRYLKKKPRFATNAQASASSMPRSRVMARAGVVGAEGWASSDEWWSWELEWFCGCDRVFANPSLPLKGPSA